MLVRISVSVLALLITAAATGCDSMVDSGYEGERSVETDERTAPVSYAECPGRSDAECPAADPLCVTVDGPGGGGNDGSVFVWWSFCTRECETDDDCPSGLEGGTAVSRCLDWGNGNKVCALDCSLGRSCPEGGLGGCDYGGVCGNHHCECTGDEWCMDPWCEGPL